MDIDVHIALGGTSNVRIVPLNGTNGIPYAETILQVCREKSCDVGEYRRPDGTDKTGS